MHSALCTIDCCLLPLSWLYGAVVGVRNWLYDHGLLKLRRLPLPAICVGNLAVGGTGKTPHVEYLVRLLSPHYRVAVLSRGYRRKSRGYLLSDLATPMEMIGDEPWQMKQKFGTAIHVAVDADRWHGVHRLTHDNATSDTQVVLLDDAFQHRAVRAGLYILLVDYHRLYCDDRLLPAGRLRESAKGAARADVVVVSKCPPDIPPTECRHIQAKLQLRQGQQLYFSTLRYGALSALFGNETRTLAQLQAEQTHVLMLTGIASHSQMERDLRRHTPHVTPLAFPDHHYYTAGDVRRINRTLDQLPRPHIVVTTEKDAARLKTLQGLSSQVCENLYVLPIQTEILNAQTNIFNQTIEDYVRQNS
ncbi:MAG: tetraacyldisaccharide 4'-kinase [Bacteroidaceae bacterium]|nr:tetraacyldisaccharide 4'-kinase [Bacteroidaceae bacterium]